MDTSVFVRRLILLLVATILLSATAHCAIAQSDSSAQPSQDVSKTGLLPVYGVDISADESWVDGSQFPSQSADHPDSGTKAEFQQLWDTLKPCGLNSIRFAVDVRDPKSAANRVANLCVWSQQNSVFLMPILTGEPNKPIDKAFTKKVGEFAKELTGTLLGNADLAPAYGQILGFQIEDCANHKGRHGAMSIEAAQDALLKAAGSLRTAEREALKDKGLDVSPVVISASFDHELIAAKAMAGANLEDTAYDQAYQTLTQFLAPIVASEDVDVIAIEWYPGSVGAGSVEKLAGLLTSLNTDLPGKQMIFVTGYSAAFTPGPDQKQFYTAAFANLADYRAREADTSTFLGVFFHEAANPSTPDPEPPAADTLTAMASWDRAAKAYELAKMWAGGAASPDMTWWLGKTQNAMGLLAPKVEGETATLADQPAKEALMEIAGAVTEANTAVAEAGTSEPGAATTGTTEETGAATTEPAPGTETTDTGTGVTVTGPGGAGTEGFVGAVKNKMQEGLLGLLDKVFQKIGDKVVAGGSSAGGYVDPNASSWPTTATPGATSAETPSATIGLSGLTLEPANIKVGVKATCKMTITNANTASEALGLTAALVDGAGYALGAEAQQSGINLTAGGAQNVELSWVPTVAGTTSVLATVYDSSLVQLASGPLDVTVTDAGGTSSATPGESTEPNEGTTPEPSTGTSEAASGIECKSADVIITPASPKAAAPVKIKVKLNNTTAAEAAGIDVLLIDADAAAAESLLAETDGSTVPAGGAKSVDVDWSPATAKAYNLSVQVWLGFDKLLAEAKLPTLTVAAASGGGGGGGGTPSGGTPSGGKKIGTGVKITPPPGRLGKPTSLSGGFPLKVQSMIPLGLPQVMELVIGGSDQMPMSGSLPVQCSLVNPYSRPIQNLSVTLLMDGNKIETKSLGTLLPNQNRSLEFKGLKTPSVGAHVFDMTLTGGADKALSGSVKSQFNFTNRMIASAGGLSKLGGARIGGPIVIPGVGSASTKPAVRSLLPMSFNIGGQVLQARPATAQIPVVTPKTTPTRTTALTGTATGSTTGAKPGVRTINPNVRATTPKTTGGTSTGGATIPGVTRTTPIKTIPGVATTQDSGTPGGTATKTTPKLTDTTRPVTTIPGITKPTGDASTPAGTGTRTIGTAGTKTTGATAAAATTGAATTTPTGAATISRATSPTLTKTTTPTITATPGTISKTTPTISTEARPTIVKLEVKPDISIVAADIVCIPAAPKSGAAVAFKITVRNLTRAAATGVKVACVMTSGRTIAARREFTVNVAANGSATIDWAATAPKARQFSIGVETTLAADTVSANNRASKDIPLAQ